MPKDHVSDGRRGQRGFSVLELVVVVAITLVLVALTGKAMFSAVNAYRVSSSARQIASWVQVARMKATARDTRYRIITSGRTYSMQRYNRGSSAWEDDPGTVAITLPPGVNFSATTPVSLSTPPEGSTLSQATDMTFNSRGLLVNNSGPIDRQCLYIQGQTTQPYAVCTTLPGRTTVYRWNGSVWQRE